MDIASGRKRMGRKRAIRRRSKGSQLIARTAERAHTAPAHSISPIIHRYRTWSHLVSSLASVDRAQCPPVLIFDSNFRILLLNELAFRLTSLTFVRLV